MTEQFVGNVRELMKHCPREKVTRLEDGLDKAGRKEVVFGISRLAINARAMNR